MEEINATFIFGVQALEMKVQVATRRNQYDTTRALQSENVRAPAVKRKLKHELRLFLP